MPGFTHLDSRGNAVMVDVSGKEPTTRLAVAGGRIKMNAECYAALVKGAADKGDVLGTARIAGIMAVKQTASLIPLCHVIPIEKASVEFKLDAAGYAVVVECTVKTTAPTGVEMEALTGAGIALLTIYDMCKAIDKGMEITGIRLLEKTGGKNGDYRDGEAL